MTGIAGEEWETVAMHEEDAEHLLFGRGIRTFLDAHAALDRDSVERDISGTWGDSSQRGRIGRTELIAILSVPRMLDADVLREVAAHPEVPTEWALAFIDGVWSVPHATDSEDEWWTHTILARNPHADQRVLRAMYRLSLRLPGRDFHLDLATNPSTPGDVVSLLCRWAYYTQPWNAARAIEHLAGNRNLSVSDAGALAEAFMHAIDKGAEPTRPEMAAALGALMSCRRDLGEEWRSRLLVAAITG